MKNIKRFSAVVGAAALFALAFTGCENFAGTEVNYSEKEVVLVGASGVTKNLSSATMSALKVDGSAVSLPGLATLTKASSQTTIEIELKNGATGERINLSSAKKAIKFYKLADSKDKDARLHYQRAGELPAKVFSESDTGATSNSTATIEFEVDTSSVEQGGILLVIDAKTLKDKQGKLILNSDGNNKRGEDSDTILQYIQVFKKANGDPSDSIVGIPEDNKFKWSPLSGTPNVNELKNDENKLTGEYEVRVYTYEYKQATLDDTDEYNTELASFLNDAYSLRVKEPGKTTASTQKLSFSWDADKKYYKASAGTPAPGTKFEIIQKAVDYSKIVPAWVEEKYGYKAFISDDGFGAKGVVTGSTTTATIYVESPDYIINNYASTEQTWDVTKKDKAAIKTAQRSFLNSNSSDFDGRFITLTLAGAKPGDVEITGKDFIIVDKNDNVEYKLPFKMKEKLYDGDKGDDYAGKLLQIEFEITNKNITLHNPILYVGSGVTLTSENKGYPSQKKFGQFKDTADGIHSGYVALND